MKTRAHKTRLQVTLTPDARAWLEREAETRGFSISAAIEQLVRNRMLGDKPVRVLPDEGRKERLE